MVKSRAFEILACLLFAGIALLVLWDIRDLPPPLFGPIGSADLPRVVSWIVLLLSGAICVKALSAKRSSALGERPAAAKTLAIITLTALYAAAVDWGAMGFGLISTIYLLAAIGLLVRPRGVQLLALIAVSVTLSFGVETIFTRFLYIDLP